jgi:hypothetical protein
VDPSLEEKRRVLDHASFGARVAEDEVDQLAAYFVETDQWKRVLQGDVDIIYGPKGSGKSALYSLLIKNADALFDRAVVVIPAEQPRGAPVFKDVVQAPPTSEGEFIALWKLYLLCLIAELLREYGVETDAATARCFARRRTDAAARCLTKRSSGDGRATAPPPASTRRCTSYATPTPPNSSTTASASPRSANASATRTCRPRCATPSRPMRPPTPSYAAGAATRPRGADPRSPAHPSIADNKRSRIAANYRSRSHAGCVFSEAIRGVYSRERFFSEAGLEPR